MCDNINIKKVGKLVTKERADADELAKKVRVLCWIMTGPDNHETKVGAREIAKDCLLTLVRSRLALGSPGCRLFVTMPKMAEYTEK